MYNFPSEFDDGLPITYRETGLDIAYAMSAIHTKGPRPDVCLVDAYHTLEMTLRDLNAAYDALEDEGVLVVHDCLPHNQKQATPYLIEGEWCGVSYMEFINFVLACQTCDFVTLDCDYGCGLIVKNRKIHLNEGGFIKRRARVADHPEVVERWQAFDADDFEGAYRFFVENKRILLQLVPPRAFFTGFDRSPLHAE